MLRFLVTNKRDRQSFDHLSGPIEFGRGPERDGVARCVIQDGYVSKDHVRIEEQDAASVLIVNLSQRNSIRLSDNSLIDKGETKTLKTPLRLTVGETFIDVETAVDPLAAAPLDTISAPVLQSRTERAAPASAETLKGATGPTQFLPQLPENQTSLTDLGKAPPAERLMEWFETFVAVQRSAAGSPEFYQQTAEAVVKLVGLDKGLVILRAPRAATAPANAPSRWMVQARYPEDSGAFTSGREFSLTILERVLKDRRTFFQAAASTTSAESLQGVEAVVASPIFDRQENVVGFVYGCRTRFNPHRGLGIGPLEAQVMQVLAASVATGLARLQHETEATRNRVQFEQFFSAELAQELQKNPQMLTGQEREITALFSDVRGFSRLSEKAGPKLTCELVADIMERLTECIRRHDGTLVDYMGDGLIAMWNAPVDQPDHAVRACRAALAMQECLPALDADWSERLGLPVKIGIGLNTGPAMCGNTGSKSRFKYGPLGHTVNLASRVEGATKQMGVPILITETTRAKLGDGFAVRRLCKVRVVGIQGAVNFYELHAETPGPEWVARRDTYEEALGQYEAGNFPAACRVVNALLSGQEANYDISCLNLLLRSAEAIRNPPEKDRFDGVLELSSK